MPCTVALGISDVVAASAIFEVCMGAVQAAAILVSNFLSSRPRPDEGQRDNGVEVKGVIFAEAH
jgi:hypothetical protein